MIRPMLKYGSRGDAVALLQLALNQGASHQPGLEPDGIFGRKTHGRVTEFQTQKHLVADGIVGPNTHNALAALYELANKLTLPTPPNEAQGREAVVNIATMAAAVMGWPEQAAPPPIKTSERIAARTGLGDAINAKGDQLRQGGKALGVIYAKAGHPFAAQCPTIPEEHIRFFANTPNPTAQQKNARIPDWCGVFCLYVYRTAGLRMSSWPLRFGGPAPEMKAVTRLKDVKPGDLCMVSPFGGRNHHFLVRAFDGSTVQSVDGNAGKYASIIQRSYTIASTTPNAMGAFMMNTPQGVEQAVFASPNWSQVA